MCYLWNSIRYWWIFTMLMDMVISILIRQILQIFRLKQYSLSLFLNTTVKRVNFCLGKNSVFSAGKNIISTRVWQKEALVEVQRTIYSLIWDCLKPPFMIPAQSKPWGAHNPSALSDARLWISMKCTIKHIFHLYSWKETFTFDNL